MESAIPSHLTTARSRHQRVPDDYRPPYPSFVARHKPTVSRVVMTYFGLQYRGESAAGCNALARRACRALCRRRRALALGSRPLC